VDITWFSSKVQNLMGSLHLDPTHLPIFLTGNVFLYSATTSTTAACSATTARQGVRVRLGLDRQ
jgi:hypothetical protein